MDIEIEAFQTLYYIKITSIFTYIQYVSFRERRLLDAAPDNNHISIFKKSQKTCQIKYRIGYPALFYSHPSIYGRLRVVALGMASLLGSRPFVYVYLTGTTSGLSLRCAIPIPSALTLILITLKYSSRQNYHAFGSS